MKYVFYLLLMANVLFFLWEQNFGNAALERQKTSVKTIGQEPAERIVLIRELPSRPKTAAALAPPAAEKTAEPSANTQQAMLEPPAGQSPPPAVPESSPVPTCYQLGPFASEAEARVRLNALRSQSDDLEAEIKPVERVQGFLVLYPKAETPELVKADKTMLIERGIKEMWVIDRGALKGAISLGLFKKKEHAEAAQKTFQEKGIKAEIQPRTVASGTFGVLIRWRNSRESLDEILRKVGLPAELRGQEQTPCG